ncbi:molybdopterin-guanine dinucleotide biosynthesis protein [Arthrobacter sp. 24S4-2]|uniref:DUF6457 domain-containing protein n=1 Tax=Arthrobacter sp. 24S4-2 TaxID=2575374 RepID=UPI0010C7B329|nr:DUF6457 domain-containing protein [Arthrobacter sp. 24S4-2]QCO97209.1 molybdopterin-guanine dinucleotide biosynthesis protein [Arthrobacter sp. 24S4-2]
MAVNDDEAQILDQWSHRLAHALQILDLDFDRELILDLAGEAARSVTHAAAPITTLMVGYAAGIAAGSGSAVSKASSAAAVEQAAGVAIQLCADGAHGGPASKGWADTAQ